MKIILFLLITIFSLNIHSQEKKEVNPPFIFGEFILGGAGRIGGNSGMLIGGELNYQHKNDLFSIRYLENSQMVSDVLLLSPMTPFPVLRKKHFNKETGFLYGRRWIYGGSSFSISGGISLNSYLSNLTDENDDRYSTNEKYLGFPFEVNFKWFKSENKKSRILHGLISFGKPTSFGGSFGFKITGNISRNSYIGLGLVYGLGIHKN